MSKKGKEKEEEGEKSFPPSKLCRIEFAKHSTRIMSSLAGLVLPRMLKAFRTVGRSNGGRLIEFTLVRI